MQFILKRIHKGKKKVKGTKKWWITLLRVRNSLTVHKQKEVTWKGKTQNNYGKNEIIFRQQKIEQLRKSNHVEILLKCTLALLAENEVDAVESKKRLFWTTKSINLSSSGKTPFKILHFMGEHRLNYK